MLSRAPVFGFYENEEKLDNCLLELETYYLWPEGALLHLFSAHLLVQVLHLYKKIRLVYNILDCL